MSSLRAQISVALAAALAVLLWCMPLPAATADAASVGRAASIAQIVVTDEPSVLLLEFDEPVAAEVAAGLADDFLSATGGSVEYFSEPSPSQPLPSPSVMRHPAARAVDPAAASAPPLSCGNQRVTSDANGRHTLDYRCDLNPIRMQWSYKLSTAVQRIVVGPVVEDGARWWRNGVSMPKNAPHTVGAGYQYHGTFNPVPIGSRIEFQDVLTFRHNVGTGGTGRVVWAGSAQATRALP